MAGTTETYDHSGALLSERELRAWRGMLRMHAMLSKKLDHQLETEHGLPLTSYEVLMVLSDCDGCRMRMCDLATTVLLSRSGLTRLIDRLERDGLIVRQACDDDARGSFAKLTDMGRERLAAARPTHLAGVREMFLSRLSAQEQELLAALWERMLPPPGHSCCD